MSADNGIYIAQFPLANGGSEFRVAHAQNIEDCDCSFEEDEAERTQLQDLYRALKFGASKSYPTYGDARMRAEEISQDIDWSEYGMCYLEFDRPILGISSEEASFKIEQLYENEGK